MHWETPFPVSANSDNAVFNSMRDENFAHNSRERESNEWDKVYFFIAEQTWTLDKELLHEMEISNVVTG